MMQGEIAAPAPSRPNAKGNPNASPRSLKVNLVGMTRTELRRELTSRGTPEDKANMRVAQIWQWIYQKGVREFQAMTNLAKDYRKFLHEHFSIEAPSVSRRLVSSDGTRKYLLRIGSGHEIETVYIPDADRGTLCVSSQVGCTLNCSFCYTGTQPLVRNLTAAEIVGQILVARDDLDEWPKPGRHPKNETRLISNIVLMGMGEPLYNFENVRDAMKIAMDNEGISLSKRRITLSTSGVAPMLARTGDEIGCRLAISFHATTDEVRDRLVPINRKWNIKTLLDAIRNYPDLSNSDRVTFEYVMIKDVNDSLEDAYRLVNLIRGIPSKVNLIPFNEWPGAPYERSDPEQIRKFAHVVYKAGYASPVRTPRGEDIMAACGQLKSDTAKQRRSPLQFAESRKLAQAGHPKFSASNRSAAGKAASR